MSQHSDSGWVTTFVFVGGFIVGAGAALFLTPESGSHIRERLSKGAKTAQEELTETAEEAKESIGSLAKEAQRTMKKTAARLNAAVDATKEAIISEVEPSSSKEG